MKILYIYNDYGARRKIYGQIMSDLGCDVRYKRVLHKREINTIKIKHIKQHSPDVLFIRTPYNISHGMNEEIFNYLKKNKIILMIYSTINPSISYSEQLKMWKKTDVAFVIDRSFCNFLQKNNVNAHYLPIAFHPSQYYKTVKKEKYDISFMGSALKRTYDKRSIYLQQLFNKRYKMKISGHFFENKITGLKVQPFRGHDIQRVTYAETKINLDLPFIDGCDFYKNRYHFKNRFFEIPATRNFLLTVRCPEFLDILPEDVVGYYDDNVESLKENVDKYLKDDHLRKSMSKKAYKLVHQKHTFRHRFEKILKILKGNI